MKPLYKEKYPHVFEPLVVGKHQNIIFKNRIFQAPVGVGATGGGADGGRLTLTEYLYESSKGRHELIQQNFLHQKHEWSVASNAYSCNYVCFRLHCIRPHDCHHEEFP